MPTALIGEAHLPKNFKRYAKQFSLLELDCEPGTIAGKAKLQSCRAIAPAEFVFSLVVPSRMASLETGPEFDQAWKAAQGLARLLRAQWWVVRTPAEVRPTRRAREGLAALTARLKEGGMSVAWEPRGLWDEVAAGETADAIGAVLVHDIAREVPRPGPVLYSRLLALGRGARIGLSLADTIAERVRGFEQAFVVVEGQGAREIQQALGMALDDSSLEEGVLDDGSLDDDEELDEGALAGEDDDLDEDDGDDDDSSDDADDSDDDDDDDSVEAEDEEK
jgi:hypothetical protein